MTLAAASIAIFYHATRVDLVVADGVLDVTGKHRLVLREQDVRSWQKYIRDDKFDSLVWDVLTADGWTRRTVVTHDEFQRNARHGPWVSELESIDPVRGVAILKIAERVPKLWGRNHTIVQYSWYEWDLLKNRQIRLLQVCKSPFEPFKPGP